MKIRIVLLNIKLFDYGKSYFSEEAETLGEISAGILYGILESSSTRLLLGGSGLGGGSGSLAAAGSGFLVFPPVRWYHYYYYFSVVELVR